MPQEQTTDPRADHVGDADWWKTAVVYQVYIRSFADADGDGIGDLAGLRAKLGYLAALGIDAVWVNPWYPSPMADGGYDVSDYRDIDPSFGTLDQAESFIAEAHELGLKVILDIVPNHTSSEHVWFQAARAGDVTARERYLFRPGKGAVQELPPNDWQSNFGGPAWTRTTDSHGNPGEWYLHLFAPGQPDLNWDNPEVRAEFEDVLRFWFDRGADGFRIDVAHGLAKAEGLPDAGLREHGDQHTQPHPAWDQEAVHDIYRAWRKVGDAYTPPRIFVAEAWVKDNERLALYLRPEELQTAFQFDFLRAPFRADVMRRVVDESLASANAVGAPSTWVLSNHDVVRHVTRYARSQPAHLVESHWDRARWGTESPDLALGARRARAAILLTLALPGTAYLYQGEELGLPEVEDIDPELRQDPTWEQSGHTDPGRDGCRVPLPWSPAGASLGFSPPDAAAPPWLPQPPEWTALAASVEEGDEASMLSLYRSALRWRAELLTGPDPLTWVDTAPDVLGFQRGPVQCWLNTGTEPVRLPAGEVLLASGPGTDEGQLPGATAAWVVDSA